MADDQCYRCRWSNGKHDSACPSHDSPLPEAMKYYNLGREHGRHPFRYLTPVRVLTHPTYWLGYQVGTSDFERWWENC